MVGYACKVTSFAMKKLNQYAGKDGIPYRKHLDEVAKNWLECGTHATIAAVCASIGLLAEHKTLQDMPGGSGRAIEEALHYLSPVPEIVLRNRQRLVLRSGPEALVVPKGARVRLLLSAANRDQTYFGADPHEFRPGRVTAANHIAFGFGEYHYPGATFARMLMAAAVAPVAQMMPGARVADWQWGCFSQLVGAGRALLSYDLKEAHAALP